MTFTALRGLAWVIFSAVQFGAWTDPAAPHDLRPHTAAEAMQRAPLALAALDGPMFDGRARGRVRLAYRVDDARTGTRENGRADTDARGITLSIVAGRAVVTDGDSPAPGAAVAVQLYPSLVRHGRVVASAAVNREATHRAAVAVLADGRLAFVVGRAPMHVFARALRALGAIDAGYTDGGGSARLAARDGRWWGSSENRRVAAWLVVRSR